MRPGRRPRQYFPGEDRRHRQMEAMTFGTGTTVIPAPAS
jgi:hypothetical protein